MIHPLRYGSLVWKQDKSQQQVPRTPSHSCILGFLDVPPLPLSFSPTAKAVSELKDLNYSDKFRETFLPDGQPLLPGMFVRRLDLAAVLELVGAEGASAFYSGNLSQEIISEVSHVCYLLLLRVVLSEYSSGKESKKQPNLLWPQ